MTQTLQEILAKNNVNINMQTNTMQQATAVESTQQQAATSSNVSDTSETQQEKESAINKVLMSSDDLDSLDRKKFEGNVTSNFHLEEDIYEAKCVKIEVVDSQDYEGRPEEKFCWHFKATKNSMGEEVNSSVILKHYTRLAFGEQSNNYKLYSIFFGSTPATYNVLDCIGQECRLNVVDKKSAKGNIYSKIKDILKAKKK